MWTTELGEWVVVCNNPSAPMEDRGFLFYHIPTDATRLVEIDEEARYIAGQLIERGARVTDDHPTLGKPKHIRFGPREWMRSAWMAFWCWQWNTRLTARRWLRK